MKPLTQLVIDYIESEGIEVVDSISWRSPTTEVARQDPLAPAEITKRLNTNVDAIVASACVQMPSLASIQSSRTASACRCSPAPSRPLT